MDWVNKELKFCKNLASKSDVINFKNYLNNLWTNVAMMDYPYSTSFLMPLPGNPVQAVCQAIKIKLDNTTLTNENKTIIEAIEAGVNVYNNFTGKAKCLNMDDEDQIGNFTQEGGMSGFFECTTVAIYPVQLNEKFDANSSQPDTSPTE